MSGADVEVDLDNENGTAIIRGKTNVPFRTFVTLILERKVQGLIKDWKDEPVVVSSELLTTIASAPDDKRENRGALVVVTMSAGIYAGVLLTASILLLLTVAGITPRPTELAIICVLLVAFAGLVVITQRIQKRVAKRQTLLERMEKLTELLTK